jgi:hypothetical protein
MGDGVSGDCACERCVFGRGEHAEWCGVTTYGAVHFTFTEGIAVVRKCECATREEYERVKADVGNRLVAGVVYR